MISIIIPTYKERDNLELLLPRIADVLDKGTYEILVVDDDSQDGSEELCANLSETLPLRFIKRLEERDLSRAVLEGFDRAKGDYLFCMDADFSHPPELIPTMLNSLQEGHGMVLASRYVEGGAVDKHWGGLRWVNSVMASLLSRPLTSLKDPMSGYFCLRKVDFQSQRTSYSPMGYKIALELLVKLRLSTVELPFNFEMRRHGESKLNFKQRYLFLRHLVKLYVYKLRYLRNSTKVGARLHSSEASDYNHLQKLGKKL